MSDYRYDAVVTKIHDGDTVTLDVDLGFNVWHRGMNIRFYGIQAPELSTDKGKAALAYLRTFVKEGDRAVLESVKDKEDKYGGRWLGTIWIWVAKPNSNDVVLISLNKTMLDSGHAVPWDGKGPKPAGDVGVATEALINLIEEVRLSDTWVRHTKSYEQARAAAGLPPDDLGGTR